MKPEELRSNELALVGSVLFNPAGLDSLPAVSGAAFADGPLGQLFDLVRDLVDRGKGIDVNILLAEVRKSKINLTAAELAEVFQSVPNATHAKYYANIVLDAYRRRRLLEVSERVRERVSQPSTTVEEIIGDIEAVIGQLDTEDENYSIPVDVAAEAYYKRLFNRDQAEQAKGVATGIRDLDSEMGEMMPGEMTVLAARPACGKTSLAMQIAEYTAERGNHVMVASLEMGESELVQRSVSSRTGAPSRDLRAGRVCETFESEIKKSLAQIAGLALTYFVPPKATLRQIRAAARLQKSRTGLKLLAIDYLGLIRPNGKSQGKYEDVTLISNELKSLARELAIPILVLCQLSRAAEGVTPLLSHLRDSGAIEQDADSVWFLEPHDWTSSKRTDFNLIVAKNRHGRMFRTELKFEGNRTRFLPGNYNSEFSDFDTSF